MVEESAVMGRASVRIRFRPDGGFRFRPGQFAFVSIPGLAEAPFSPFSAADAEERVEIISRMNGPEQPFAKLKAGETVGIRGPYGRPFSFDAFAEKDFLFLCDAAGLAAARPLLIESAARPEGQGRTRLVLLTAPEEDDAFAAETAAGLTGVQVSAAQGPTALPDGLPNASRSVALLFLGRGPLMEAGQALAAAGFAGDSMFGRIEKRMACGIGHCRLCAAGPVFTCVEGPILPFRLLIPDIPATGAA